MKREEKIKELGRLLAPYVRGGRTADAAFDSLRSAEERAEYIVRQVLLAFKGEENGT